MEKGRENCRKYVEERKLVRVAQDAGVTSDEILEGYPPAENIASGSG